MLKNTKFYEGKEDPIFSDIPLYKVVKTNKDRTVVVHVDGSVSMIIPFEGINNTSMSEPDFENLFERIKSTLNDLDSKTITAQFVMVRDNNVGQVNTDSLPTYLKPRADYLSKLADNYELFVNRFYLAVHSQAPEIDQSEGMIVKYYRKYKYRNDVTYKFDKAMGGIDERVTTLVETADALCSMLTDIGAQYRIIKKEQEYYNIFQQFTRPGKSKKEYVKVDSNSEEESPRQAIFSGVRASIKKENFSLDGYLHQVWTMDRAPRNWVFGKSIEAIEQVPFEFIYSVTFRTTTAQESLRTFKWKVAESRIAAGQNEGALVEDLTLEAAKNRILESYRKFADGNALGVVVSVNFVMRVKESYLERVCRNTRTTKDEMLRRFDQMLSKQVFSRFGASEWINEQATGWKVFCTIIPGFSTLYSKNSILKNFFLLTDDVPYFMAIYDNKRPLAHNGTNHFIDMRNNRVVFRLDDPSLPAWNYSISGQTGSGKSVLVNALLTMQFADTIGGKRPVICILDVGGDRGSYTKFMELVKGTQINLSKAVKPSIQMFQLIPERSSPTPGKVKEVAKALYEDALEANPKETMDTMEIKVREYFNAKLQMPLEDLDKDYELRKKFLEVFEFPEKKHYRDIMKLNPGEVIPDAKRFQLLMGVLEVILSTNAKMLDGFQVYDYDEVSKMVRETYQRTKGRFPYMSDFLKIAKDMVDEKNPEGAKMLIKLENYTRNGAYPMFDADTNIDISNDVILADLKGLEGEPQLQMIYTLLISQIYNDKMYFVKDRRKLIVRDEAWSLMQNERARRYFVEDLRTARKNGFATIAISQLPTDYLNPSPSDGKAIISNMQVNIFCKFSTDSICQEVGREYNLSQEIIQEMKGLGVQKVVQADGSQIPSYAKFMMVIQENNKSSIYVLKNMLHPFEYALYSSSAEDNAVIDYYLRVKKSYEKLEDVLWLIAENRHIGDQGLVNFLLDSGYSNMARRVAGIKKSED